MPRLLLLCLLLPGLACATNPGTPEPPTNPPAACSGQTLQAGEHNLSVNVNGQQREFILYAPPSYNGNAQVPLLLDFHALLTSAEYQRDNSGTREVAQDEGFLVAYPQGIDNAWNLGPCCTESRTVDDVAFARAMVADVVARSCVDQKRVYATGYSNGGGMAYKLACSAADLVAAVAPAAFDMIEEMNCAPSRPISVFAYRGRLDPIVPYSGGPSTPPTSYPLQQITFQGAQGSFNTWAALNNCSTGTSSPSRNCTASNSCEDGSENVLCTARFGGHSAWDAQTSWDFLKTHQLP
ncbi:alpha/beta hydrolase family esterase [Halopseudomonas sabulinigri]|uniref:PHB depolymerase family esterase n=1 Tax=Halopseudomonas sabulinigri TaxID=472181 RepID=A0ABP9ZPU3_9GAMM